MKLPGEGGDCCNHGWFREKIRIWVRIAILAEKEIGRESLNGSMGGTNPIEKSMFFGGYKNIKKCASAGIKYDTGSKILKVIYELTIKFKNESREFPTVILEL
jgi:hypothetical protein